MQFRPSPNVSKRRFALSAGLASLNMLVTANAMAAEDMTQPTPSGIPEQSIASQFTGFDPALVARSELAKSGILYGINYVGEVLGNPRGGFDRGAIYEGFLEVYVDADLEKLLGWKGLTFHASGFQLHGQGLTTNFIGNVNAVSNIEATPSTRLFDLWLEQSLFDDKLSIRFGQLRVDYGGEFLSVGPGGIFISANYGWPSFTASNLPAGGVTFPLAGMGARVKVEPADHLTLLFGVYNDNSAGPDCEGDPQVCNDHGLEFRLKDDPFVIAEAQVKYSLASNGGLPGIFKAGAFRDYGKFDSQRFEVNGLSLADPLGSGVPRKHQGNFGLYAIVEQQIYQLDSADAGTGVSAFARIAGLPADFNVVDFYLEGGLNFSGLVPDRPNDVFGIAVSYSRISGDAVSLDRDRNSIGTTTAVRDFEVLTELTYVAQVMPGWTIQPDLQYIWRPGGNLQNDRAQPGKAIEDAVVVGLRSTVNY